MKVFSSIFIALSSVAVARGEVDGLDEFEMPPLDEHQKAALSQFQDKNAFAEAWKNAAHDLHQRYEKIRQKHSHGVKSHSHKRKIRKVVYVDADDNV
jgi:hypothetical protein